MTTRTTLHGKAWNFAKIPVQMKSMKTARAAPKLGSKVMICDDTAKKMGISGIIPVYSKKKTELSWMKLENMHCFARRMGASAS